MAAEPESGHGLAWNAPDEAYLLRPTGAVARIEGAEWLEVGPHRAFARAGSDLLTIDLKSLDAAKAIPAVAFGDYQLALSRAATAAASTIAAASVDESERRFRIWSVEHGLVEVDEPDLFNVVWIGDEGNALVTSADEMLLLSGAGTVVARFPRRAFDWTEAVREMEGALLLLHGDGALSRLDLRSGRLEEIASEVTSLAVDSEGQRAAWLRETPEGVRLFGGAL